MGWQSSAVWRPWYKLSASTMKLQSCSALRVTWLLPVYVRDTDRQPGIMAGMMGLQQLVCVLLVLTVTEITGQKLDLSHGFAKVTSFRMKSFQFMENMCTIRLKENATNFKESLKNTVDCQQQIINDFLQEMNPNIQIEQIIRKGCSLEKHIMKCNENINQEIQRCLIGQERDVMNISLKTMRAAVDYVCYNDGERIALFLDNDGLECVLSQMNNISTCVKEKLASVELRALEELSSIGFSEDVCKIVNDIPQCVVEYTGKCSDSTPSDILDSLHKHILKMTPCWQGNSAPTQLFHSSYLLVHLLTLVTAALFAANILV